MKSLSEKFKKALIIEDDESLCDIYKEILDLENISIDIATNIATAENLLGTNDYDLLIVDWNLNGHSSSQILNNKKFKDRIPSATLIITGYSDHEDFDKDLVKTFNVLYKPFSLDLLRNVLIDLN